MQESDACFMVNPLRVSAPLLRKNCSSRAEASSWLSAIKRGGRGSRRTSRANSGFWAEKEEEEHQLRSNRHSKEHSLRHVFLAYPRDGDIVLVGRSVYGNATGVRLLQVAQASTKATREAKQEVRPHPSSAGETDPFP